VNTINFKLLSMHSDILVYSPLCMTVNGRPSHRCTLKANSLADVTSCSRVGLFPPPGPRPYFTNSTLSASYHTVHQSGELENLLVKEGVIPAFLPAEEADPTGQDGSPKGG
jgi:hypothetical protein